MYKLLMFGAMVSLLVAGTASANLLTNGGFESDGAGTNPPTGWVSVAGDGGASGAVDNQGAWSFPSSGDGARIYDWVSSYDKNRNNAYIYQQFTQPTNALLDYSVKILTQGINGNVPTTGYDVNVTVYYDPLGGTNINAATWVTDKWNNQAPVGDWATRTGQLSSGASTTGTIFIKVTNQWVLQWNQAAVDAMVVTPEPATALLLGLPLLLVRRRRA